MDKILVELFVPAIGETHNMLIPRHLLLRDLIFMVKKAVSDMSDGRFVADDTTVLCRNDGAIMDINLSVHELGIHNGSKLMLI